MFARLEGLERTYTELETQLAEPDVFADQERYRKLTKAHAGLHEVVGLFRKHRQTREALDENSQLLNDPDPELRAMVQEECCQLEQELPKLEQELKMLLLPADPLDAKNTILEIRAGTGGEEA
ncbi:MAG: PCRF domain-containing protein, partial [Deltaproteobacteria bacterium]|nr:PCRF domain-containing protein [Deltaproteobacteria bacterium]